MRRLPVLVALPLAVLSCSPLFAQQRLTYEDVRSGKPIRWESDVPNARLVDGGRHVELRAGSKRVWLDPATGKQKPADNEPPALAATRKVAFEYRGELWSDELPVRSGRRFRGRRMAPTQRSKNLAACDLTRGPVSEVHLSPDGKYVSYVQGNDLHLVGGGETWRVTDDGGPERFHGKLDWVYQEELYGRGDFQAHWWSPVGGRCAFLSLDEEPVREFTVIDHVPDGFLDEERAVVSEVTNYPKAGDPNPFASLSVAHMGSGEVVKCDLSRFPKDLLVVRVDWTPDGETLLATIQDRIQTWAELCAIDPKTGEATTWIREESHTWVNRPAAPRWLADGTFLWLSERTGYQHVYHYAKGGELIATPTSGEWQVRSIVRVDEARRLLW
ncbi:MAG: DPP IV N-terminal domain-containing protein, partial [Planctomycetes bacterium]|nr:DPP IV N-terminal domain-containing protein [Planctomycetota bacterium]